MSLGPPAAKGTMTRIGRLGKFSCAESGMENNMAKITAMNDRIMMGVPPVPIFCSFSSSGMIAKVTQNCKL